MGHCSTAEAICDQLRGHGPQVHVHVVDFMESISPGSCDLIYGCFNFSVQYLPFLYNTLNVTADRFSILPLKWAVVGRMDALWAKYRPDLVICTLPMCTQYVSAFKKATGTVTPMYTYITDITTHEEWITADTDLYFVGAESTKSSLISRGVPADKIVVSGIPVRTKFHCAAMVNTEPSCGKAEILIMGGSLGLIPACDILLSRLSRNDNVHITLITGENKELMRHVRTYYPGVTAIGWTQEVDHYLKKSDLLVTKAGGITIFEAINASTPLYILRPFLAQEIGNAEYIEQNNIGQVMWTKYSDASSDILSLLNNPSLLRTMKKNMDEIRRSWHSYDAVSYFANGEEGV